MQVIETSLSGLIIIEPRVFEDARGYFYESFNLKQFADHHIPFEGVQDNQSLSRYGVIRGLHYQLEPYAQGKLVRVLEGSVWDVALDIRKNSKTYGKWFGTEISAENRRQLFVPRGFAHGFAVTSPTAVFFYKCDRYYNPEAERGIHHADPDLKIDWPIPQKDAVVSKKDQVLPSFSEAENNFI